MSKTTDKTTTKATGKPALQVKCPTCSKKAAWANNPTRPFCSVRCRNIDLGNWADGTYAVESTDAPSLETLEQSPIQDEEL